MKIQINCTETQQTTLPIMSWLHSGSDARTGILKRVEALIDDPCLVLDMHPSSKSGNTVIGISFKGHIAGYKWNEVSTSTTDDALTGLWDTNENPLDVKLAELVTHIEKALAAPIKPIAKTKWCLCHNCQKGVEPCINAF